MGSRIFQLLLLGIFIVLFMDKVIRFCNFCDVYNGHNCEKPMQQCWKFNSVMLNRSCRTDHFYYSDRLSGRYLFRYSTLSCETCQEGMVQVFHDLLRETFCCTETDLCNDPDDNPDTSKPYVSSDQDRII
ncbi:prostate and testis expressed protein 13-like [Molossus nigricans]